VTCAPGYTGGKTTYSCNVVNGVATYQPQGAVAECVLARTCAQYTCAAGTITPDNAVSRTCTDDANCQAICCINTNPPPGMRKSSGFQSLQVRF
jgi:hypothetical protein